MIGRTLTHYQVLEEIGAGGMGMVYRARDLRLERDVALKVLSDRCTPDGDSCERLRREALALSSLNHPNIGTIFDYDESEGQTFFAMEFLPGGTLAELIARGPIAPGPAARLGAQIAGALEAAHEKGVLHRDLKPANILLSARGDVKVVDFGLARALRPLSESATTRPITGSGVAGTLAYMSPEQLLGRELDARSDLYALGVVLHEMLSGRRPHEAALSTALVNAIINEPPTPLRSLNPSLPEPLEALVLRLLQKEPAGRFDAAGEVARQLEAIASGTTSRRAMVRREREPGRSLAVLPLHNLSLNPEEDFFADGMTESLISDLSQIEGLRVISRSSSMRFKGSTRALGDIARELRVDTLLEGSVLRSGERVRVSLQLVEAATDRNLWARRYERERTDILALQAEVAQAVAREIRLHLSPRALERMGAGRPVSAEAHEAYLRGRQLWNRRTAADVQRAITYFSEAVTLAPHWGMAWAGLSDAYSILGNMNVISSKEARGMGLAAARKAVELEPDLAEARTSLAQVFYEYDWKWAEAEAEYRSALALNPNYASAHQWLATMLEALGRFDESVREVETAEELDPLSPIMKATRASALYYARRFEQAVRVSQEALAVDPDFVPSLGELARSLEQLGRLDSAIGVFRRHAELTGTDPAWHPGLAHALARAGRAAESRAVLGRMIERSREHYVSPYAIATVYTGLGEVQPALDWLEKALEVRDRTLPYLRVNPRFDPLRQDPRYRELERRLNFPAG